MLNLCLSILKENGFNDILVVNNASTDDTADVLLNFKNQFNFFEIITLNSNTGGSGGFYNGILSLLPKIDNNDYIILHDDDSWPNFKKDELLDYLFTNRIYHGCFPVIHPNGDLNQMNIPGNANFLNNPITYFKDIVRGHYRRPKNLEDFKNYCAFDYSSFVGYIAQKSIFSSIGIPNPNFFLYSDDTSYTYKAACYFGKVTLINNGKLIFIHDCNRSTGRTLLNSKFLNYEVKNKIIFFRLASEKYHLLFSLIYIVKSIILAPKLSIKIIKYAISGYLAKLYDYQPIVYKNDKD
jgi:GT2 family glycosyltransferase